MSDNLSPAEQLAHSTVRIETLLRDGRVGTGTGFFYNFAKTEDGKHVPVIVTNKHVVAGAAKGTFKLTLRTADGEPDRLNHAKFALDSFQQRWIAHPDGVTDLCCMPMAPLLHEAAAQNKHFFSLYLWTVRCCLLRAILKTLLGWSRSLWWVIRTGSGTR